jgi:hypothetical protein
MKVLCSCVCDTSSLLLICPRATALDTSQYGQGYQGYDTSYDTVSPPLRVQNGVGVVRIRINPPEQSEKKIGEFSQGRGKEGFKCNSFAN